jgi:hypothetical protein
MGSGAKLGARWRAAHIDGNLARVRVYHCGLMRKSPQRHGVEQGSIYRDLDGQLVCLVKVRRELCTWIPVSGADNASQITHRDNFVRRFTPLKKESGDMAA